MVRKLKYHEKKLLKKVDFITWKSDRDHREIRIIRKYQLQKREDYTKYNRLALSVQQITSKLKELDCDHPESLQTHSRFYSYAMGLIPTRKSLELCERMTASSFCKRRLPVVMVKIHMAQRVSDAVRFVEQGHVRVGPEIVTDPAYLVTR
ncbi:PREDICTED: U3 small nucleolar ribonucleoprotein protein IMP3-like [Amphimedon queenslandica]|uniref:Small ribosomal subunit protein uS4 N-terminal domain-containing protein n=2 Tax=Amphimedon queenslandica TaxID=400682 RepID=A0AAN0IKM3_AMPQE|nr:PREDICTED: U3 small nucleolar ribonucleoprotein protein IMP3-like [Amphimedon queenslandica]|eukprot:XP_011402640.1 PREDICTED: U3 small nucleolar ribonucleoprotein protein IMP3-like [Amphimedon queenslandica]